MKKISLKQNKGISMTDITIAVIILLMFVGVIGRLFYNIALNNIKIEENAIATYYVVKLAEDIDKMSYNQVTKQNLDALISSEEEYNLPENFNIEIEVENYKDSKAAQGINIQKDIIKICIFYSFVNQINFV